MRGKKRKHHSTDLLRVNGERALALAVRAVADSDLLRRILIEGTEDRTALPAVELDVLELREDARTSCHDTRHPDEIVQVAATQVTKRRAKRQVCDADVHFGVNALV